MTTQIQANIVEKYKARATGIKFFGHAVQDLSRDELLACLGAAQEQTSQDEARRMAHEEVMNSFREHKAKLAEL